MRYTLKDPWIISSRLMPAVQVGGATLSLGDGPRNREGRTQYECWIDLPDGSEHEVTDLRSGCQGGSVREGMTALLWFLGAAAESRQYRERTGRQGESEDLFPPAVVEWAAQYSDEISMLQLEIEESPDAIQEG